MNPVYRALAYLLWRSSINRIRQQLIRLRQPRYLIGAMVGLAYLWFFLFRPDRPIPARGQAIELGSLLPGFFALALLAKLTWDWFRSKGLGVFSFTQGEAHYLFTGPIRRSAMLSYLISKGLATTLMSAAIITLISIRFGGDDSVVRRFFIASGIISFLMLHRAGTALLQIKPVSKARRSLIHGARLVFILALLVVLAALRPAITLVTDLGFRAALEHLATGLNQGMAGLVLSPFKLLTAPLVPQTVAQPSLLPLWLAAIALYLAVIRLPVDFREAALASAGEQAEATSRLLKAQTSGAFVPSSLEKVKTRIPLRAEGHPAVAIVWKNSLVFFRGRMHFILLLITGMILMIAVLGAQGSATRQLPAEAMAALFLGVVIMLSFLGPGSLRNDIRADVLYLSTLKSWPLPGMQVVIAELASPVIFLTLVQVFLIVAGVIWVAIGGLLSALPIPLLLVGLVLSPILILELNLLCFGVHNVLVLAFPSWVRFGQHKPGVEMMGQNIIVGVATILAIVLILLAPVVLAAAAGVGMQQLLGESVLTLLVAGMLGIAGLGLELFLMFEWAGRIFERSEPADFQG